jgi:hypothetical protein
MFPGKYTSRTVLRVARYVNKEKPVLPKVGHGPPEIAFSTALYGVARKWIVWETAHIESPQASGARLETV